MGLPAVVFAYAIMGVTVAAAAAEAAYDADDDDAAADAHGSALQQLQPDAAPEQLQLHDF